MTDLINISAYCTPEEYEHLKSRRDDYIEKTGRNISISRFVIEQPDRQQGELAALKRVHELDCAIVDMYNRLLNQQATSGGTAGHSKHVHTKFTPSQAVTVSSEASDDGWAEYQRQKEAGNTIQPGESSPPNPHILLLAELEQKFAERRKE